MIEGPFCLCKLNMSHLLKIVVVLYCTAYMKFDTVIRKSFALLAYVVLFYIALFNIVLVALCCVNALLEGMSKQTDYY